MLSVQIALIIKKMTAPSFFFFKSFAFFFLKVLLLKKETFGRHKRKRQAKL
jgi:hypothetical protein